MDFISINKRENTFYTEFHQLEVGSRMQFAMICDITGSSDIM